jgi:hypothetical protein
MDIRALDELRGGLADTLQKLDPVEGFVNEKYFALPRGEDVRGEDVKKHLDEVLTLLRDLSKEK